jgi:starch-binding outer membrane protein, SusD/RagB family
MHRKTYVALACLGLLLGTAGCNTFLTGDKLSQNPNLPTAASIQQLFVGVQAGQFAFQEGTIAMMMCEWVQACSATNSRFVQQAAQYVFDEGSNIGANGGDWITVYDGGGLVDMRLVEADAQATGDSTWLGIAKIWEALTIGTASDMWGNIPYSQAVAATTSPPLDNRFVILGNLQTLLSDAIAELTTGSGTGPSVADLVFGGNRTNWIKAAWTLKARYYMHTAESLGTPAYTAAIAAATNGISDPTGASDFSSFHSSATSERNMWTQFQTSSGFGGDLEAGKALVDYMNARGDPRRAQYFCRNKGGGYGGDDFNTVVPADSISNFQCLPPRFQATTGIPYVSYVENELILAEAYNQTGNDAAALTHLNNARATVGAPISTPLVGITGAALLDSIMMEKFVAMFQNIESMNDYRRTCIPALTPSANSAGFTHVPGRLFYPRNERNVNTNVPDAATQLATHGFRNAGDVHACQGSDNLP